MRTSGRGTLTWLGGLVLGGVLAGGCGGQPTAPYDGPAAAPTASSGITTGTGTTGTGTTGTGTTVTGSGVQGTVTDTAGVPVVAATLDRRQVGGDAPLTALAAVSGPDGRWAWALPPGTWDVTATAPGHRAATGRVVVVEGEQAVLDLVLPTA